MKIPGYVARMRVRARAKQTMPTIDDAYDLYDAGALDQAAETCRSLLGADPASFSVLYLLGTILGEQLAFGDAIACLGQAIVLRPDVKVARFNLASVLSFSDFFHYLSFSYLRKMFLNCRCLNFRHFTEECLHSPRR
jgi:tetratricopeptide (TPR) repeat protein